MHSICRVDVSRLLTNKIRVLKTRTPIEVWRQELLLIFLICANQQRLLSPSFACRAVHIEMTWDDASLHHAVHAKNYHVQVGKMCPDGR